MEAPFVRIKSVGKVPPFLNNNFSDAVQRRALGETGPFNAHGFWNIHLPSGHKLVTPVTTIPSDAPADFYVFEIEGGGIYLAEELEFVTRRELELENILFDIQSVFPNKLHDPIVTRNSLSVTDFDVLSVVIPEARRLLRSSPMMRLHRKFTRMRRKINRFAKRVKSINSVVLFDIKF